MNRTRDTTASLHENDRTADLPGWPVPTDRVTIPLPDGITLRQDEDFVYICDGTRTYPLPVNIGASVLSLIVEEIAEEMKLAAELAPNGMAFSTREETER